MTGDWRRSSYCADASCVEVASRPDGTVRVRESRHPDRHPLTFTAEEWRAFVLGVQAGEFPGGAA